MDFRSPDCNSLLGKQHFKLYARFPTNLETKDDHKKEILREGILFWLWWLANYLWTITWHCLNPTMIDKYRSWTNHCHRRAHSRHVCRQLRYQGFASEKDIGTHQHEADPGEKEYDCLTGAEDKGRVAKASYHMIRMVKPGCSEEPIDFC